MRASILRLFNICFPQLAIYITVLLNLMSPIPNSKAAARDATQGQIMVGIIKAKPWGRSYKTPSIIIINDFAAFWFLNATSYHILA